MKAYLLTSGTVFALILLAHMVRLFAEGLHPATQPVFIFTSLVSAALCFWAFRLLSRLPRA